MSKFSEDIKTAITDHINSNGLIVDSMYGFILQYNQKTSKIEIVYNQNNCLCAVGCLVKKLNIQPKQINSTDLRDYLNNLGDILYNLAKKYSIDISDIIEFTNGFDCESFVEKDSPYFLEGYEIRKFCLESKYL